MPQPPDGTTLRLIPPTGGYERSLTEMAADFAADGEPRYLADAADLPAFVERARDSAAGRNMAPGRVPESHFWLVLGGEAYGETSRDGIPPGDGPPAVDGPIRGGTIVGNSRIRHALTPGLMHEGGHIGYDIRPAYRRRGFGTVILRLSLEQVAELGIVRARVTCDADNVGSVRIIERNGGVLDGEGISPYSGFAIRQYWVAVGGAKTQ